jgi:hypothetical protein
MLCYNPNITIKEVKELFPKLSMKNIQWYEISKSAGITMQDIEDNPDLRWNWSGISENPNLTLDFILKHIDKGWVWYLVVKNPGIKMDDIEVLLGFPQMAMAAIKFMNVSIEQNPNTTIEFIEKYYSDYRPIGNKICYIKISREMIEEILKEAPLQNKSKKCDDAMYMYSADAFRCSQLSRNKNIDIDLVLKYKDFEWGWHSLSENPAIKMNDIENNMDLPWVWECVSLNPNLTAQFVIKYPDKNWSWSGIMINKFNSGY